MSSSGLAGAFSEKQREVLKVRGVRNERDLLFYLPRLHLDLNEKIDPRTITPGETYTLLATVENAEVKYARRRRLSVYAIASGFSLDIVFFQAVSWYQKVLTPGTRVVLTGNVDFFRSHLSMTHPDVEILSESDLADAPPMLPIYHITEMMRKAGLTSRTMRLGIEKVLLPLEDRIDDHLTSELRTEHNLLSLYNALLKIHLPENAEEKEAARRRLAFDELLSFSVLFQEKRRELSSWQKAFIPENNAREYQNRLLESLPFSLTTDQQNAIADLTSRADSSHPFSVLLQGDVGSGKTLVALMLALHYAEADLQIALMAPTETLARQHYLNFISFLSPLPEVNVDLLLGAEKARIRAQKLDHLSRGETHILVGTHSLIQEDIAFHRLALVIVDEQQRFGVEQRNKLRSLTSHASDKKVKGKVIPDLLTMTATPIPRSLALALYGDLDPIVIREKPKGRIAIKTMLFSEDELPRLYLSIKKYVEQGRQAYIVYPAIEESDAMASLMQDYAELEKEVFPEYRLGLLHGRLSQEEKENAMRKFREGTIQILVATTVIEVGVDVPNATVILIRNAERFGLSQLHQLRGRVGRGNLESFCILTHADKTTRDGRERLKAMVESDDGFYLAQKDLEIRGTGEVLGTKQSGDSEFRIADLRKDSSLAALAQETIESDEELVKKIKSVTNWKKQLNKGLLFLAG